LQLQSTLKTFPLRGRVFRHMRRRPTLDDRISSVGVDAEVGFVLGEPPRNRWLEKPFAQGAIINVEPEVSGKPNPPSEQLFNLFVGKSTPILSHHRLKFRLELIERGDKGGIVWIEHVVEHHRGNALLSRPVPIGKREVGVATLLPANLLKPAEVPAMPDEEPPIAVGTVKRVR